MNSRSGKVYSAQTGQHGGSFFDTSPLFTGLPRGILALHCITGAFGIILGHPNPVLHLPLLALWTPFVLYVLVWFSRSPKEAFIQGWLTGLLGYTAALYWLYLPITQVGGLPLVLAAPCVILLSAYIAAYTGMTALAARNLLHRAGKKNYGPLTCILLPPLVTGLAWGGFEVILGGLLTGFPWLGLSTAFVPWPAWIQAASVIGAYALSALYAAGVCFLASCLLNRGRGRWLALCAALLICAGLPLFGELRLQEAARTAAPLQAPSHQSEESNVPAQSGEIRPPVTALMVQGNIDQNQKWVPAFQQMAMNKHMNLTVRGLEEAAGQGLPIDLVLWPETAMPFYFQPMEENSERLRRFAVANGIHLGFGTLGYGRDTAGGPMLFNRVQFISSQGSLLGHYDKEHLVPFGEYTPFALDFEFLKNLLQGVDFASGINAATLLIPLAGRERDPLADAPVPPPPAKGEEPPVIMHGSAQEKGQLALGMLICYEVIFPELAQARVEGGATVLATVSNDAWFGQTPAPRQHVHLAAMRAVEQGRAMLRATNTGYTTSIDAYGHISEAPPLFTDVYYIARVQPRTDTTVYHHLHPLPQILLALFALLALLLPLPSRLKRRG